jgi:hypothetical protein
MAWEARKGKGRYYTRSRKENGRTVREYLGSGDAAELIAQLDNLERQSRNAEKEAEREFCAELDALEKCTASLNAAADSAFRSAMQLAGYHQHRYGEWRKKRDGREG